MYQYLLVAVACHLSHPKYKYRVQVGVGHSQYKTLSGHISITKARIKKKVLHQKSNIKSKIEKKLS